MKPQERMRNTLSVMLSDTLNAELTELAERERRSVSSMARELVRDGIRLQKQREKARVRREQRMAAR